MQFPTKSGNLQVTEVELYSQYRYLFLGEKIKQNRKRTWEMKMKTEI